MTTSSEAHLCTDRIPWPEKHLPLKLTVCCPVCGGALSISAAEACELADNGEWVASEITVDCANEPDMEADEWEQWHQWHYSQPYIDWLPLERIILRAVQKKYYFPPDDS